MSSKSISSLYDKLKEIVQLLKSKAKDRCDEVRNEELQAAKRRKSEFSLWLERVTCMGEEAQSIEAQVGKVGFFGSRKLMQKLMEMIERAEKLIKQSEFPRGVLLDDLNPHGLRLVPDKLEGSTPSLVQDVVWSCFGRGETRVGLFGMGGVGKTSISMHINNKILEQRDLFDHVYYVTVSRKTSILKLQGDIAKAFGFQMVYEDEPKRAAELSMALGKRARSLLILDDVWEHLLMEKVGVSVEGDGCKLLITTRKKDVCRKMECFPVKVKPLLENEAWDLFKKKLGDYEALSDEAQRIARLVAEECDGLPLGIVALAGSMRGENCEHVWRDALRALRSPCSNSSQDEMDNNVFSILRFSYDRLKDEKRRKCFLYCALYPENWQIDREELINGFIALGMVGGGSRLEKIDRGHTLLNDLVNASLLEHVTDDEGHDDYRRCVKMHDLVRDMAIKIIGASGMVKGGIGLREVPEELLEGMINKDLEWVSLVSSGIYRIRGMSSPNCPNVSAFVLQCCPLEYIPNSFFVHMISLKVLNLSGTYIKALPASVSYLVNLNTILLSNCLYLTFIPSLANLTQLSNIVLKGCKDMEEFPNGIGELIKLEHLVLTDSGIRGLHEGVLCKLVNLEVFCGNNGLIIPPMELASLRYLKTVRCDFVSSCLFNQCVGLGYFDKWTKYIVTVNSSFWLEGDKLDRAVLVNFDRQIAVYKMSMGTESFFLVPLSAQVLQIGGCRFGVRSLLEALPSLCDAAELKICKLIRCEGIEYIFPDEWYRTLDGIQSLSLEMCDDLCGLIREGVVHPSISFGGLTVLEISKCHKMKRLWILNLELPNLVTVVIQGCAHMEVILATREGDSIKLPKLRSLKVVDLPELRSIWGGADVLLPCLFNLVVQNCPKIIKVGSISHVMPFLKYINHIGCEQMEEIFAVEGAAAAGDNVASIHFPNLVSVWLSGLPELRSIWGEGDNVSLPHLVKLEVKDCPKLRKLGLASHNMLDLETIVILDCKQMEKIFASVEGDDVAAATTATAILFPNLKKVHLSDLPELRSIWGGGYSVSLPHLVEFELWGCPKLRKLGLASHNMLDLETIGILYCKQMEEIFASVEGDDVAAAATTILFPNLKKVELSDLPELRSIWGEGDNVSLPHLVEFMLWGCPKLRKPGLASHNMLDLETMDIIDCKQMEEIFASVEGDDVAAAATAILFPNLKKVELSDLPELRSIWGGGYSVSLPHLVKLKVKKCPKLRKLGLASHNMPDLETIFIFDCKQMEEIFASVEGDDVAAAATAIHFPNLKKVELSDLPELRSIWGEGDNVSLPHLVKLEVKDCPKLRKLGLASHNMHDLETIDILDCKQMEEIFASLEGDDVAAAATAILFSNLKKVELFDLPELRSIWGGGYSVSLPHLVKLKVKKCPKLRKLGLASHNMPDLETIFIFDCKQMEEIFASVEGDDVAAAATAIHFPNLKKVELSDLPELRSIWGEGDNVSLPHLVKLEVKDCPKLRKLGLASHNMLDLETIVILDCKQMEKIFASVEGDDVAAAATTIHFPNLVSVLLSGLPELRSIWGGGYSVSLPHLVKLKVQNCPKLRKLGLASHNMLDLEAIYVIDCKQMEEIFASVEGDDVAAAATAIHFPNLKNVELFGLPELRSIWGEGDNVSLPHLVEFVLWDCPKLRKLGLASHNMLDLETIVILDCKQMEKIFASVEGDDVAAAATAILFPNLKKVNLSDLPELRSIWGGGYSVSLPHLVEFELWGCPKLRKLGLASHNMLDLETIGILDCKQMEEIFASVEGDDVAAAATTILFPNLKKVELFDLPELRSIRGGGYSVSLPHLVKLKVKKCPKLRKLGLASHNMPDLETIYIFDCKQMEEILHQWKVMMLQQQQQQQSIFRI